MSKNYVSDIFDVIRQADVKNRTYYTDLPEEDRKKVGLFVLNRWCSSILGNADLQTYYLMSCNERLNKHWFDLSKFPELQWLLTTTGSNKRSVLTTTRWLSSCVIFTQTTQMMTWKH